MRPSPACPSRAAPSSVIDETGEPFRRCLAREGAGGFPLLKELVVEGATKQRCFRFSSSTRADGRRLLRHQGSSKLLRGRDDFAAWMWPGKRDVKRSSAGEY